MINLIDSIKGKTISTVDKDLEVSISSLLNEPNKLKVAFVLCDILKIASSTLEKIDLSTFVTSLKNELDSLIMQTQKELEFFKQHDFQNDLVLSSLINKSPEETLKIQTHIDGLIKAYDIVELKREIETTLEEFDTKIRSIVLVNEKLPLCENDNSRSSDL